jgi:hypothetical protein
MAKGFYSNILVRSDGGGKIANNDKVAGNNFDHHEDHQQEAPTTTG